MNREEDSKRFNLLILIPNSGMTGETLEKRRKMLQGYASPETRVTVECIPGGPESIESETEEFTAGIYILKRAETLSASGFDSMIVYCFSDPAVHAARELSDVPVIGPGYVTLMIAQEIADRYSVLTVLDETVSLNERKIRGNGMDMSRCASVRSIDIPVSDLREDLEATYEALKTSASECMKEDGAHCIVLACLGMAGLGERLQKELGIPVLDPAPVSVRYAELLNQSKLTYSRLSYGMSKKRR